MAEGGGLLNRYRGVNPYRGFESLLLRFLFSSNNLRATFRRGLPFFIAPTHFLVPQ